MGNIEDQIKATQKICDKYNKRLEELIAKRNEYPRLQEIAKKLASNGNGESYIQSRLYATRTPNISIDDIALITKEAMLK